MKMNQLEWTLANVWSVQIANCTNFPGIVSNEWVLIGLLWNKKWKYLIGGINKQPAVVREGKENDYVNAKAPFCENY